MDYDSKTSTNITDPDPWLQAFIATTRRDGKVRGLLDAHFDKHGLQSPRSNMRMVEYLTVVAQAEGLGLQARRHITTGRESEACRGVLPRVWCRG